MVNRLFSFVLFILLFSSCASMKMNSESIAARQVGSYEMEINVSVIAESEKQAKALCISKAFDNVLFIGTPNTINSFPLLEGQKSSYQNFFDSFINKGGYAPFVTSVTDNESVIIKKFPKEIKFSKSIRINIQSLRTYLTREGNIRQFGY